MVNAVKYTIHGCHGYRRCILKMIPMMMQKNSLACTWKNIRECAKPWHCSQNCNTSWLPLQPPTKKSYHGGSWAGDAWGFPTWVGIISNICQGICSNSQQNDQELWNLNCSQLTAFCHDYRFNVYINKRHVDDTNTVNLQKWLFPKIGVPPNHPFERGFPL